MLNAKIIYYVANRKKMHKTELAAYLLHPVCALHSVALAGLMFARYTSLLAGTPGHLASTLAQAHTVPATKKKKPDDLSGAAPATLKFS